MKSNNEMYRLFNEMTEGYKSNNEALFNHAVRCWMNLDPDNPFDEKEDAYELFFRIKKGYTLWSMAGPDMRINKRRMLEAARLLCALNPTCPYKFNEREEAERRAKEKLIAKEEAERKAKEEAEKKAKADVPKEAKTEPVKIEPEHIQGVVPEKKKGVLWRLFHRNV